MYTVTLPTEGTPTTKEVSLERLKEERELERISCAESQTVVERLEASFLALDLNVEHTTPKSAFFCVCDSSGSSSYLLKHTGLKKRSTQQLMPAFVLSICQIFSSFLLVLKSNMSQWQRRKKLLHSNIYAKFKNGKTYFQHVSFCCIVPHITQDLKCKEWVLKDLQLNLCLHIALLNQQMTKRKLFELH